MKKTLPGFELTIEDNAPAAVTVTAVEDVIVIYGVLPETLKYEDDDGTVYDKYIEPNKPMLITKKEEAIKTLDISDMLLTREIKNIIQLIPNGTSIALCKIVKRNGESPNPDDMIEMYEALDFAFESTENYPLKQPILAGVSLDDSLSNEPGVKTLEIIQSADIFDKVKLLKTIGDFKKKNSDAEITKNLMFDLGVEVKRDNLSANQPLGKGLFSDIVFTIDGEPAQCIVGEVEKPMEFKVKTSYVEVTENDIVTNVAYTINGLDTPTGSAENTVSVVDDKMLITIGETFKLVVDEEHILEIKPGVIELSTIGQADVGDENLQEAILKVGKNSAECNILKRTLEHVHTITATKNNAFLIMSPEPPRNSSTKAVQEYVDRVKQLTDKVFDITSMVINGSKVDAGMYLSIPVGVNRIDGIGGVYGFPQASIASVDENTITTLKPTTAFDVGDNVEIYTYDKLDIITLKAKVISVSTSEAKTTSIVLDQPIPVSISSSHTPKYIMNVNDKDLKGNYMSVQWANVIQQVGVTRSAAGVTWNGECQLSFSAKQLDELNACKLAVLDQITGTSQGTVSKSQLMTKESSQFQDIETLVTVYSLVAKSKKVGNKYVGERIDDTTGLAVIKTELEGTVFDPAVGVYITNGYDLRLYTKKIKSPSGNKSEKALMINFAVTEIETLKLLRITARIN
jgi:hypothetical protein